jgi:hypothetical protein
MSDKKFLSCSETAALVRKQLKLHYPGIKFYVRSKTYSGGASIDIAWIDGPGPKDVERIAKAYEGADFDGMQDLKTYKTAYLFPDGTAQLATVDDGNTQVNPKPAGAVEVYPGADFIFCNRHVTPGFAKPIIKAVCDEFGVPEPVYYENQHAWIADKETDITVLDWDACSPQWNDLSWHINQEVHKRLAGETANQLVISAAPVEPKPETPEPINHLSRVYLLEDD